MRISLKNTQTHDHERLIRGLAKLLNRKPDDIAADCIELGWGMVVAAAIERPEVVTQLLAKLREDDPELMEAAGLIWTAAIAAAPEQLAAMPRPTITFEGNDAYLHFGGRIWRYVEAEDWFEWTEPNTGEPTRIGRTLALRIAEAPKHAGPRWQPEKRS